MTSQIARPQAPSSALPFAALALLLAWATSSTAAPGAMTPAAVRGGRAVQVVDLSTRLDVNRLDLFTSNIGAIGYDLVSGNSGLYFPRGVGTSVLFASGVWVGAKVGGQTRVTVAEYSMEYTPGDAIVDPAAPTTRIYKMKAFQGDPADITFVAGDGSGTPPADPVAHDAWSDYETNATPMGAPTRPIRIPDFNTPDPLDSVTVNGPDLPGDLALWTVYHDLDPIAHSNNAGSTPPLGIVVEQTVFGFGRLPSDADHALQDVAYVRLKIRNAGANTLDSTFIGYWADPDIGGPSDDLAAWAAPHGMGYVYGGSDLDFQFGAVSPALGIALIPGSLDPNSGQPIVASSFGRYISGTDPSSATESFFALTGLQTNGQPWVDPVTQQPTRFPYSGDPVAGSGWLDIFPADRRTLLSVGPVTLSPGQEVELTYAIAVGQGTTRFESITRLKCAMGAALAAAASGFARPFPTLDPSCDPVAAPACPLSAPEWATECATPTLLTPLQLETVANNLVGHARAFAPVDPPTPRDKFCAMVSASAKAPSRAQAEREFIAMHANGIARTLGLMGEDGNYIGLPLDAPVTCEGLTATTVRELLARCPDGDITVTYEEVDAENPRDLQPVDWGGSAYAGAADFGINFFGSALDPAAGLEIFPTVEVRLGGTQAQKAYRYLRLELVDGSAPPQGREYRYGGYRDVPFRCVDPATGNVLEAAFVERVVTDEFGTILPPGAQPATFDSTWLPDASDTGSREYLFVLGTDDTGSERAEFAVDGFIIGATPIQPPTLYAAWTRRIDDVFEDGEKLVFLPEPGPSTGADRQFVVLARRPQDDPATLQAYEDLYSCLHGINYGQLSKAECDGSVPVLATLVESSAGGDGVHLAWFITNPGDNVFDLERKRTGDAWRVVTQLHRDEFGYVRFHDPDVTPGSRLSYRLVTAGGGTAVPQGEVTIEVPGAGGEALALAATFNPGAELTFSFNLPARGQAKIDLYTLVGRRIGGVDFGTLDSGRHTRPLPGSLRLPSGVYLARLRHGGNEAIAKAVFVH